MKNTEYERRVEMEIAYTSEFQIINAKDAISGKKYYCPFCNGKLHFYPGKKRIPHFRHAKGVPIEQKERCELYASTNNHGIYVDEVFARQRIRLAIEKNSDNFKFKLKFPIIQKDLLNMQIYDKYFDYSCNELKGFKLNSIQLLPSRMNNDVEVPLMRAYTLKSSNEKYEQVLGLKVSGTFEPFEEGPLIFKEISGQYVSVPYRKLILSGRFFVVSLSIITFLDELEVLFSDRFGRFFIYEVLMPLEITDELQSFFEKNLRYTLLPATCRIDLVSPNVFKKSGNSIQVSNRETIWQITNMGETFKSQKVIIENKSHERQIINLNDTNQFKLTLTENEYNIYIDEGISETITVKKVSQINHHRIFRQNLLINNENVLFNRQVFESAELIDVEASLNYYISNNEKLDYKGIKKVTTPWLDLNRITIPTLWSIEFELVNNENSIDFLSIYKVYKNHKLYPKVICRLKSVQKLIDTVRQSKFEHKNQLLYYIRLLGYKVPQPIVTCIKEIELSNDSTAKNIPKNSY